MTPDRLHEALQALGDAAVGAYLALGLRVIVLRLTGTMEREKDEAALEEVRALRGPDFVATTFPVPLPKAIARPR